MLHWAGACDVVISRKLQGLHKVVKAIKNFTKNPSLFLWACLEMVVETHTNR